MTFELTETPMQQLAEAMEKQNSSDVIGNHGNLPRTSGLAGTIWRSRWIVLVITILSLVAGFVWTQMHSGYQSEGIFRFGGPVPMKRPAPDGKEPSPGISQADFNRYFASYTKPEQFDEYIREKKLESVPGVSDLRQQLAAQGGMAQITEPVYSLAHQGSLGLIRPKEAVNVLGLRISYAGKSPEAAPQMVELIVQYARDRIIHLAFKDEFTDRRQDLKLRIAKFEAEISNLETDLEDYGQKASSLKQLMGRTGGNTFPGNLEVAAITEDSARFLPLPMQVAATEVQTIETAQLIQNKKRKLMQDSLQLEYCDLVLKMMGNTKSGEASLKNLELIKDEMFKRKDLKDNKVRQVFNAITMDNRNAEFVYIENSRFVAGPTLPQNAGSRPLLTIAASLIAALILSVIAICGRQFMAYRPAKAN